VVDAGIDPAVNSAVLVDNFSVTKIPEPSPLIVFGLGLIAVARALRHEPLLR
jgi:PEP-CTERM motif